MSLSPLSSGVLVVLLGAAVLASMPASADFIEDLERVDQAIRTNPSGVLPQAVRSCLKQRNFAVEFYKMHEEARAQRSLDYCFKSLMISKEATTPKVTAPSQEALQARAIKELKQALTLTPDVGNGLKIYRECAACHKPEGWGLTGGSVPQIAGQHRNVVIKQLADIRAGNRDAVMMAPYSSVETIGGAQAVADVAAYIGTLEITVANGKGPGKDLELGEQLYGEHCADCHGASGEGDNDNAVPRIHAQHYKYLVRQFEWIRDGKRRNSDPEMVAQIAGFEKKEIHAVMDYVSRLQPPEMLQAPPGWKNPDFTD